MQRTRVPQAGAQTGAQFMAHCGRIQSRFLLGESCARGKARGPRAPGGSGLGLDLAWTEPGLSLEWAQTGLGRGGMNLRFRCTYFYGHYAGVTEEYVIQVLQGNFSLYTALRELIRPRPGLRACSL